MTKLALVTGGSGYFGELLSKMLLDRGDKVRIFDLNQPGFSHPNLEFIRGDIRNEDAVRDGCEGVDSVFHNVAHVPLAKEK